MSSLNYNFTATLMALTAIEVAVNKPFDSPSIKGMSLYENKVKVADLKLVSRSESNSTYIYSFNFDYKLIPGCFYELVDLRNEHSPLNITYLARTKEFEETYRDDGELGAIYSKEKTTFRVFSPLASEMMVKLVHKNGEVSYCPLKRLETGVYQGDVLGDLDGCGYLYIALINGQYVYSVDPYAKSVGLDSQLGYVVDMKRLDDICLNDDCLPSFSDPCQAVLYELDVRDMTSLTDLSDKGTFKALYTEGNKTSDGFPIGIDYIASLGVTHIQLLPVFDFQTISDDNPCDCYNWGYDPLFYFAIEGSYSSVPSDPYNRMEEFKTLVSSFHKKGIRVNMDVVFNHTMSYLTSSFNRLCPGYCYRYDEDGHLSAASGCGNDIESRNYMMRKFIIDNLLFFEKYYGIDGFRFDLMGIIDIQTIQEAFFVLKGAKPSLMMYGEGWDLPTLMDPSLRSSMNNAFSLKDIGFFNDRFRDVTRGHSYGKEMSQKGYLTGDVNYSDGFKHVLVGSVITLAFPPLFDSPKQSINYVECHDDGTLYDKIKACCPNEKEGDIFRRLRLINAITVISVGVPFIHAGQEYGDSKNGVTNTYNLGDKYNGFNYQEAFKNSESISYLKEIIYLKKKYPEFVFSNKKVINKQVEIEDLSYGGMAVKCLDNESKLKLILLINPSNISLKYSLKNYCKVIFDDKGLVKEDSYTSQVIVPYLSMMILLPVKD